MGEPWDMLNDWELLSTSDDSGLDWSWPDSPSSQGKPDSGNVSLDLDRQEDKEFVDRAEVDGVRFGVYVPTHPWMLRLRDLEGFDDILLMTMMQEYWDAVFPTLAPISIDTQWILRRPMLRRLGLPL